MSAEDVIAFALRQVSETSSEHEFKLAGLDPTDEQAIQLLLEKLASQETELTPNSAERWIFAVLLYRFETAVNLEEFLQSVEEIYCDFDHPAEMYEFVPWLPPLDGYDPTAHSLDENERRIVQRAYEYLASTAARFKVRSPVTGPSLEADGGAPFLTTK